MFSSLSSAAAAEAADFLLQANALLAELVQQEKVAALEQKKVDIEFVELLKEIRSSLRALVPQPHQQIKGCLVYLPIDVLLIAFFVRKR